METSSPNLDLPPGMRRGRNLTLVSERTTQASPSTPDAAAREAALQAKEAQLAAALATVQTAFGILGARALVILTATASAGAFAWALAAGDISHIVAASLFTAFVFWPALYASRN